MATESFKEIMEVLLEDYIDYASHLNETQVRLNKPDSFKLSLLDYSQLYMDFLAISVEDSLNDEDYALESDLPTQLNPTDDNDVDGSY